MAYSAVGVLAAVGMVMFASFAGADLGWGDRMSAVWSALVPALCAAVMFACVVAGAAQ